MTGVRFDATVEDQDWIKWRYDDTINFAPSTIEKRRVWVKPHTDEHGIHVRGYWRRDDRGLPMTGPVVPASTSVKRNRVGNIDTDRLNRRRDYLLEPGRIGGVDSREELRARVVELNAIETELVRRGELDPEGTRAAQSMRAAGPVTPGPGLEMAKPGAPAPARELGRVPVPRDYRPKFTLEGRPEDYFSGEARPYRVRVGGQEVGYVEYEGEQEDGTKVWSFGSPTDPTRYGTGPSRQAAVNEGLNRHLRSPENLQRIFPPYAPAASLASEHFVKRDAESHQQWADELQARLIEQAKASGLYSDIQAHGVRVPVQVFVPKKGDPEISTGHHRLAVAQALGIDVPVYWYGKGYSEMTGQRSSMDPKEFNRLREAEAIRAADPVTPGPGLEMAKPAPPELSLASGTTAHDAWQAILDPGDDSVASREKLYPDRYLPRKGFGVGLKPGAVETRRDETTGQPPMLYDVAALPENVPGSVLFHENDYGTLVPFDTDVQGRPLYRVPGSDRAQEHVYRVISEVDYQEVLRTGEMRSDSRMNLIDTEGTAMSRDSTETFYFPKPSIMAAMPEGMGARIVKIRVRPDMKVDTDGYVKTSEPIPASAIDAVTPALYFHETRPAVDEPGFHSDAWGDWKVGEPDRVEKARKAVRRAARKTTRRARPHKVKAAASSFSTAKQAAALDKLFGSHEKKIAAELGRTTNYLTNHPAVKELLGAWGRGDFAGWQERLSKVAAEVHVRPERLAGVLNSAFIDATWVPNRASLDPLDWNPDAVVPEGLKWSSQHAGDLVTSVSNQIHETIRRSVTKAVSGDIDLDTLRRDLEDTLPLLPQHRDAVEKFRANMIAKGFPKSKANVAAKAYAKRLLAYRADMVARTETMSALNAGQRAYWDYIIASAGVPRGAVYWEWVTHDDEKVCEMCGAMDGVRTDGMFTLVIVGGQINPGGTKLVPYPPAHPNCRCTLRLKGKDNVLGELLSRGHLYGVNPAPGLSTTPGE